MFIDDISKFSELDIYFAELMLSSDKIVDEDIRYALAFLFYQSKQGHLCVQIEGDILTPLKTFSDDFIDFIISGFKKVSELIDEGKLGAVKKHGNCFYLHKNWVIENKIVAEIKRLEKGSSLFFNNVEFREYSEGLLKKELISKEQYLLFKKCELSPLIFLSGGPGTGKTYTASKLFEAVANTTNDLNVIITAPTGKAVSNLQEKISGLKFNFRYQIKTMHSLLRLQALKEVNFANIKLKADLIIVDESSMIDNALFALFLSSINAGTVVIFMGDQNQLPPVDGGNPFAEIISARKELCVFFKQCHRFKNSYLSDTIIENKFNEFIRVIKTKSILKEVPIDTFLYDLDFNALVQKKLIIHSSSLIDPMQALKKFEKFRILNCIRQGKFGVDAINSYLYSYFLKKYSKENFACPILITENNFRMGLYNGITGVMVKSDNQENAYFMINGELKVIHKHALPKYEISFVISVHKSQGSEYEEIYLLMAPGSENFGRQVLYTAITRAKEDVKIVGPLSTVEATIKNFESKHSKIVERLRISSN